MSQLADGTSTPANDILIPLEASGLSGITTVADGDNYSLFLKNDGTVWASGLNTKGHISCLDYKSGIYLAIIQTSEGKFLIRLNKVD